MIDIRGEVSSATLMHGVEASELSSSEAEEIRAKGAAASFSGRGLKEWPRWIWEYVQPAAYAISAQGWRWISAFSPSKEVIMFFAMADEPAMYRVSSGVAAETILADCTGFEVYFTDRTVDYLLGHNHHDCVFACGTAKQWLEQHKQSLQRGTGCT